MADRGEEEDYKHVFLQYTMNWYLKHQEKNWKIVRRSLYLEVMEHAIELAVRWKLILLTVQTWTTK